MEMGEFCVYYVIFRNKIGKTLYQANLQKTHSKTKVLEEKPHREQLKCSVAYKPEPKEKNQKLRLQHLKLSFSKAEDRPIFEKAFNEALKKDDKATEKTDADATKGKEEESKEK